MLALRDLVKYLRVLRLRASVEPITEDYRGWSWFKEPVKPPSYRSISLSDFAYLYCQSMRNIYLKYILKVEPKITKPLVEGAVLHEIVYGAIEDVRRIIYNGAEPENLIELLSNVSDRVDGTIEKVLSIRNTSLSEKDREEIAQKAASLYRHLVLYYAGELKRVETEIVDARPDALLGQVVPQFVQFHVDGYLIGLSRRLVVDAVMPGVIIELKFGNVVTLESIKTALAGYALAIESDYEIPVDFGLAVKVTFTRVIKGDKITFVPRVTVTPVYLSNEVRYQFLMLRDEAYDVLESQRDPGIARNCPEYCPYYHICRSSVSS